MSKTDIFVSFDIDHDGELYELLLAESTGPGAGFAVSGGSERSVDVDSWRESARQRIREADQVIVICGEHTETSISVSAELRIAQEERIPYLLLWGRREIMCTKPIGAKPAEGMYSWTQQILQDQLDFIQRNAAADAKAEAVLEATPKR